MTEQEKQEKVIHELELCLDDAVAAVVPRDTVVAAIELLKVQEPHNCTDCIHYDKKHAVNGYAKCRNSLSPLYCSMLSETNGCDYMERL